MPTYDATAHTDVAFDDMVSNPADIGSFSLSTEEKPEPLIPNGVYFGNTTAVTLDYEKMSIDWTITLDGNGGVLSDGETPVDGATVTFKNWLPKPGDESVLTTSGKSTKRQSKINSLARFARDMAINMDNPSVIHEALVNASWIGIHVKVKVESREWEGRTFNDCKSMTRA